MNNTLRTLLGHTLASMYNNATGVNIKYDVKKNEWKLVSTNGSVRRIKYNEAGKEILMIDLNYLEGMYEF